MSFVNSFSLVNKVYLCQGFIAIIETEVVWQQSVGLAVKGKPTMLQEHTEKLLDRLEVRVTDLSVIHCIAGKYWVSYKPRSCTSGSSRFCNLTATSTLIKKIQYWCLVCCTICKNLSSRCNYIPVSLNLPISTVEEQDCSYQYFRNVVHIVFGMTSYQIIKSGLPQNAPP